MSTSNHVFSVCRIISNQSESPNWVSFIEVDGPYPYAEAVRSARATLKKNNQLDKLMVVYNNQTGTVTAVLADGPMKIEYGAWERKSWPRAMGDRGVTTSRIRLPYHIVSKAW